MRLNDEADMIRLVSNWKLRNDMFKILDDTASLFGAKLVIRL